MTEKQKELTKLLGGFLMALLSFLGILGLSFDWFTVDSINAFLILLGAFIPFAGSIRATWMNTYYGGEKAFKWAEDKKAKQEEENKKVGL